MRRLLIVLAVLIAACSPSDDEAGATTTSSPPTTAPAPTSTSAPAEVTTTIAATTTSTEGTTTTSEATTTTIGEAEGNWADLPLVTTGLGALGWWDGISWIRAEDEGALPVFGGENYQLAVVGTEEITVGGPQTHVCEPILNLGVELDAHFLLGEWPGPYGVAISAPWELQPHLFESFEDDGTYAAFASELLSSRGLVVPNPVIKQLFRTDLEGDGTNEVLVVAEEISGGFLPETGDYSIAFMRKVVQGDVQTAILGDSVITDPEGAFNVAYTFGAVADLSGDGQMELVLDSAYFEGLGVAVWEYIDDDLGPIVVLETGCGS